MVITNKVFKSCLLTTVHHLQVPKDQDRVQHPYAHHPKDFLHKANTLLQCKRH